MSNKVICPVLDREKVAVYAPHTTAACFLYAREEVGENPWRYEHLADTSFFTRVLPYALEDLNALPKIKGMCSRDIAKINKILAVEGFEIRLSPPVDPADFGVAAVYKAEVDYRQEGEIEWMSDMNGRFVGVKQPSSEVYYRRIHALREPVIELKLQDEKKRLVLTKADTLLELAENDLQLAARWMREASEDGTSFANSYEGVHFPMIDMNYTRVLSEIIGASVLSKDGLPGSISEAFQQAKFLLDEIGFKVELASAMGVTFESVRQEEWYKIDEPFIALIYQPGLNEPLFAGYLPPVVWNQPLRSKERNHKPMFY